VFAVITVAGPVTGAALNPARYIGPMIARALVGGSKGLLWGQVPVYFIATFAGGLLAVSTLQNAEDVTLRFLFRGSTRPLRRFAPVDATPGRTRPASSSTHAERSPSCPTSRSSTRST
jgi:hypothetical protein